MRGESQKVPSATQKLRVSNLGITTLLKTFKRPQSLILLSFILLGSMQLQAQQKALTLNEAIKMGLENYQSIQAKRNYLNASKAMVKNTRNEYIPSVVASIQQDYGTVNQQIGPLSGFGGYAVATAGALTTSQSWNAGFGALYLANANWEFFTFGRLRSKIKLAKSQVATDSSDLTQEEFVQSIKIAGAYLNLLTAQQFVTNAKADLNRIIYVQQTVHARTESGLNAGVDSSVANAQVSAAKIALIQAINKQDDLSNQLAQLINTGPTAFILDTSYLSAVPAILNTDMNIGENPQVKYYQARVNQSIQQAKYLRNSILPGLNLFGIFQTRGSGFNYNYSAATSDNYSKGYAAGVTPGRSNYLLGMAIAWDILSPVKIHQRVVAQKFVSAAYQNEYNLIKTQLQDQLVLSDQRIANSLQNVQEVPLEFKAATDAYNQKSQLYKNGLANIVEVQQALYAVTQAETDRSIAFANVWQALLLKAAATGDIDLFMKQVK